MAQSYELLPVGKVPSSESSPTDFNRNTLGGSSNSNISKATPMKTPHVLHNHPRTILYEHKKWPNGNNIPDKWVNQNTNKTVLQL